MDKIYKHGNYEARGENKRPIDKDRQKKDEKVEI